jgi:hypothetical protein
MTPLWIAFFALIALLVVLLLIFRRSPKEVEQDRAAARARWKTWNP